MIIDPGLGSINDHEGIFIKNFNSTNYAYILTCKVYTKNIRLQDLNSSIYYPHNYQA